MTQTWGSSPHDTCIKVQVSENKNVSGKQFDFFAQNLKLAVVLPCYLLAQKEVNVVLWFGPVPIYVLNRTVYRHSLPSSCLLTCTGTQDNLILFEDLGYTFIFL